MKVTNCEISERLKAIGFEAETNYVWIYNPCTDPNIKIFVNVEQRDEYNKDTDYKAYDLETILDALPQSIKRGDKDYFLALEHCSVYYDDGVPHLEGGEVIYIEDRCNEQSLVDIAARLLIKLVEDKIINLKDQGER